jgi:hypothetical protein
MKERWFSFDGVAIFDHETKRFWHRNKIKQLGVDLWKNMEMDTVKKRPNNKDLSYVIRNELSYYTDKETYKHKYWDDEGRWELVEIPYHIGFGIMGGDDRFYELVEEMKK